MKPTESLAHIDYLQVTGQDSCEVFCGSDQEWYRMEQQRLTGCGPSVAANILFYISRKRKENCCGKSREDLLRYMEMAWQYVTPLSNGIPSTALFREKMEHYAANQNENFQFFILDIPSELKRRPILCEVIQFVQKGLCADTPIAFLNLDNGAETALETWHWVTIAAIYTEEPDTAEIDICDEGIKKRINLSLWLKTTVQGGGFIYLLPTGEQGSDGI